MSFVSLALRESQLEKQGLCPVFVVEMAKKGCRQIKVHELKTLHLVVYKIVGRFANGIH